MTPWLDQAMHFEPSLEMKRKLDKNRETFAQYVVRVMSYSCPDCDALPGIPCDERIVLGLLLVHASAVPPRACCRCEVPRYHPLSQMSLESELQARLLLVAPERLPTLRLFRRNVGKARIRGYEVRFGLPGQCDLYGYLRGGRTIEIELKAPGKRIVAGSDQDRWRAWCVGWGVPHVVLTGAFGETVEETAERWCAELAAVINSVLTEGG